MTVRLAHLSDVHITTRPLGWQGRDWLSKRVTGWINTHFGTRRRRFAQAAEVLDVLVRELRERRPDVVVFSGDATMLGFPAELARAAAILRVGEQDMPPGFAVPGNHDYYTPAAERSGAFEQCFAPWQAGERIDGTVYPFARPVGGLWLIGVNSSVGNRLPWDARGHVGAAQLQRLARLLEQLPAGPRILVTHYPVAGPDNRPEGAWHRLRDLADLEGVARGGRVGLWLHGHRHEGFVLDTSHRPGTFPAIGAGSATEVGRFGYNEYTIGASQLDGTRRTYDPQRRGFREAQTFVLELPG